MRSVSRGLAVFSSGRLERRETRANSSSKSALIQTEIAAALTSARVSGLMKAPPPVPSTTLGFLEQPRDDRDLAGAEIGLAMQLEDVLDRHPRGLLDLLVAVDEVAVEPVGEAAADGGLARAHHADEHERPAAKQPDELVAASGRDRPARVNRSFPGSIWSAVEPLGPGKVNGRTRGRALDRVGETREMSE